MIKTDQAMISSRSNRNAPHGFNLYGTEEIVSQWEIDGNDFTYDFIDDKPYEYHTGQFYSEEHGIVRSDFPYYSEAVKYNNRLFVIDGSTVRWSEQFKFDMFKPESIYEGKDNFNKMVIFRDVLFLFSETNIVVLNYSGSEVNWRTSDTIEKIGTPYVNSITSTPVGVFFANEKGIYVLASQMQMGKQSYTEFQSIDEGIKDQFDFSGVEVADLVGHYDFRKSRYILSDASSGTMYIFSIPTKGWFLRTSSAYPSIVRSVDEYILQKASTGYVYTSAYDESVVTTDYARITTGWFFVGDPHNTTWFRELFLLIKNGVEEQYDTTSYTAEVIVEHDDPSEADWDLGDISADDDYFGSTLYMLEEKFKINAKLKKFRLKITSNYPIFEYDNMEVTYAQTGTY